MLASCSTPVHQEYTRTIVKENEEKRGGIAVSPRGVYEYLQEQRKESCLDHERARSRKLTNTRQSL